MRLARIAVTTKGAVLFASLAVAAASLAIHAAKAAEALQRLEFVTESGVHAFRVELADAPEERAKGLMFRRSMPRDQGMLFDFHQEVPVMMWMKNTYIPLDMVFVSQKGVVTKVETAKPLSEDVIDGGQVLAVVELNAGVAREIGLKPGDAVRHPAFKP